MNKILSIIIPVFNEESTLASLLARVAEQSLVGWEKEIILVDDGSTDGSRAILANAQKQYGQGLKIILHKANRGKGAAVQSGIHSASGDAILVQDADLEYDPADWPTLLAALEDETVGAVFGSRNINPRRRGYQHYVWGVAFLTHLVNFLFNARLTDVYTGYKLIRTPLLKSLALVSTGFEFEAEAACRLLQAGVVVKEVPIRYEPRSFSQGKKIRARDGLKGLWTIVKIRFGR
jgi:glycosyltransferase involved in cell wall biosynthesis